MNLVDSSIVMKEAYESRYGIFNHRVVKDRPLASVAMHPSENFTERGPLRDSIMEYGEKNYSEIWGISLNEYLNMPKYMTVMLKELTKEILSSKKSALDGIKNQFDETGKKK